MEMLKLKNVTTEKNSSVDGFKSRMERKSQSAGRTIEMT